jgi:hypothetical protein
LKDSLASGRFSTNISEYLKIPKDCIDRRKKEIIIKNIQLIKSGP